MPENGIIVLAPDEVEMARYSNAAMIDKMQEEGPMTKPCGLLKIKNYDHVVIYVLIALFALTFLFMAIGAWGY